MDTIEGKKAVSQVKEWVLKNRAELLNAGIITIVATHSGEGDSGSLDETVEFLDKNGNMVEAEPEDALFSLLEALHGEIAPLGYENNEGGGGEFRLDLETGTITHESYYLTVERSYNALEEY